MAYDNLLVERDGAVATITINRPDKLNALNHATVRALDAAFNELGQDDAVRAVIITGAGDKAFVAGADIGEINKQSPQQALTFARRGQAVMRNIEQLGKPVIAAINGFALGGGFELALACTLRIAADTAKLGLPEIKLGIMPGFGGTQRVARLAGRGVAADLALTGRQIDAEQAERLGLVHRVVPAQSLLDSASELAAKLADNAPIAMANILAAIDQGSESALDQALEIESQLFALCCATEDMQEGTEAFLAKRQPQFKGR